MSGTATKNSKQELPGDIPRESLSNNEFFAERTNETIIPHPRQWFVGRTIAIAINDQSVELVAVKTFGSRSRLLDAQKVYIPTATADSAEYWTEVSEAIEEFLGRYANRNSRICMTVASEETAFRTFPMPAVTKKQLSSAIVFEVRKQLPFPIDDCLYDYRVVSKLKRGDQTQLKISMCAATKRLIAKTLAPIEKTGRTVGQVYNAPEAIGRLLKYLPDYKPATNYALINIEQNRTQLVYFHGTELIFYHYSSLGSSTIAHRSDVGRFEDFAQLLATEIQNSLDYYAGLFSTHFSNKVFVHGDLAYADELVSQLKSQLGFDFCRFPAEELSFVSKKQRTELMGLTACLPAMGAAVCEVKLSNLLPTDRLATAQARTAKRLAIAALLTLTVILFSLWGAKQNDLTAAQNRLSHAQENLHQYQESEISRKLNLAKRQLVAEESYLQGAKENAGYYSYHLKELSRITPRDVALSLFEINHDHQRGKNTRLVGVVRSTTTPPEILLADFVERLQTSSFYSEVAIERYRKTKVHDSFELEFEIGARGIL